MQRIAGVGFLVIGAVFAMGLMVVGRGTTTLRDWMNEELQYDPLAARQASVVVSCDATATPISPLIYGIGGHAEPWELGVTARRHGGNPTSRYNWELDTWNAASDWFFKNTGGGEPGHALLPWLAENRRHGITSVVTIPTLGWVAKDASSYSFPVRAFGPQQATAPETPDAGNGVGRDGKPIPPGPPAVTSVRSTPETIERWIRKIRENDGVQGRSVDAYILDNEPALWNATHRDVHPEPVTYDELLEMTIAYASMIRRVDPGAKIAGPAEWGWAAYHYSAQDSAAGVWLRPDRRRHGDVPLIPWYLRKLREHEKKTGVKLLDILDVHYYPMGDGVHAGKSDPATNSRRLRSTRSLWDPIYKDESWVDERMRVIPLLKEWIADNYPGVGLSIGEWNFGGGSHISTGLATAEVLGRFGTLGVTSAYFWGGPDDKSPNYWAFRAYRNFDGEGGRFQDWSLPVKNDGTLVSLFASRDEKREKLVAVLLNLAPLSRLTTHVTLQGCGAVSASRGFTYAGGKAGYTNLAVETTKEGVDVAVAPYTINIIDLTTTPAKP